jgi:hypothetical protein
MLRSFFLILALVIGIGPAASEPPPAVAPGVPTSVTLQPVAIYDKDGRVTGGLSAPLVVMSMPFTRLHRDPIQLTGLGPTPKRFAVTRPEGATTYRIVVVCNVPIRVMGVMNETEQVSDTKGLLYLPFTETTMGTSKPNWISAKTVGTPEGDCFADMHYGVGGG